jgi:glycosyltransferase involved in cell wall biosynthesis
MSKQTIVMIGNMSWGMFKFRSDLMREFLKIGHRVVVIAPRDEWSKDIEGLGCEFIDLKVDRKGVNPFKDLAYTLKLTKLLLALHADIALCYTIKPVLYGSIASWLSGVPQRIAITTGLGYTFSTNNWINTVTKCLYKFALIFASQVWFLNKDDLSIFLEGSLVKKSKTFILPGEGVDVEYYKPVSNSTEGLTFTLISRMLWDKGVGLFAECAEEIKKTHPHIKFLLVGPVDPGNPEGIPLSTLQEWNKEGFLSYLGSMNDVRNVLKITTCLVHPTYYKEGLPRVLMEANSMGIPCITTDIPGCRDVITDKKNGFLIEPKNKIQLKKSILDFVDLEQNARNAYAQFAREKMVKNFSSERINSIYIKRMMP